MSLLFRLSSTARSHNMPLRSMHIPRPSLIFYRYHRYVFWCHAGLSSGEGLGGGWIPGILGAAWMYLSSMRDWERRSFLRRVNLSLCMLTPREGEVQGHTQQGYALAIRTLFEKDIDEVFLRNKYADRTRPIRGLLCRGMNRHTLL